MGRFNESDAVKKALVVILAAHLLLFPAGVIAAATAGTQPTNPVMEVTPEPRPEAPSAAQEKQSGLKVGSKVTIRRKSQILEGTLKKVTPDNQPVMVLTETKGEVPVWLKDVKRIILTGDVVKRGPLKPKLRRGYLMAYRFETIDGLVVEGGPTVVPFFEFEDADGKQNLHLRQISLIETGDTVAAPGLTIGSRVRCKLGEKGVFGTVVGINFPNPAAEIVVATDSGEQKILPLRDLIRISLVKTETGAPAVATTKLAAAKLEPAKISAGAKTYELTTTEGKTVRGKILQPPQFSIDTGNGISRNVWAEMQVIEKQ